MSGKETYCLNFNKDCVFFQTIELIIIYGFFYRPAVPRKGFGSADYYSLSTIYIYSSAVCTQSADPNPFRDTHCILGREVKTERFIQCVSKKEFGSADCVKRY